MDKNAIKKYAVWARRELIYRVSQKAYQYGIRENDIIDANADSIDGKILTNSEKKERRALIEQINEKGFEQAMEEAAYTWFNRFSALRFMEVNGYLPTHLRVFTDEGNNFKPQIITEAIHMELNGLDMDKIYALKETDDNDELFKYLLITQCNALNEILPGMFQRIADYTELLFPDNLLREGSVIEQMITLISEDDWKDAVQIIGWLYQYYNSEPKDIVFANLKKEIKITKENIPAATQLFTPDWIVRYMVENSLGRLWFEGHPDDELKSKWNYYLDEAEQEADVHEQLTNIREEYKNIKPEEIKVMDCCMGSGHILVYAFDVLMQIYEAYGFNQRDAAKSIVENNIWGLDIDERAAQLAYFAVMMKARQYDRRFFSREVQPHVYAIRESNHLDPSYIEYFVNGDSKLKADMSTLVEELHDAKEYGSILNVSNVNFSAMYARLDEIRNDVSIFSYPTLEEILPFVQVAEAMAQKYDVVVTNPPYMAISSASAKLNDYVNKNYIGGKTDLFATFIEKCISMSKNCGFVSMITMQSWMFLISFEKLRRKMLEYELTSMAHMGARGFDEISGEVVQTTAFILRKTHLLGKYVGNYARLIDGNNEKEKEATFLSRASLYQNKGSNFLKTPQLLIAYWVSEKTIDCFATDSISKVFITREGMATAGNDKFLRLWHEVGMHRITFCCASNEEANERGVKWVPYNKGGTTRSWYGNNDYIVDWSDDGKAIRNNKDPKTGRIRSHNYNGEFGFKEGLTWSAISSGDLSVRYCKQGFLFDSKGAKGFAKTGYSNWWMLGLLNSKVAMQFLQFISPTLDFKVGDIISLPYKNEHVQEEKIVSLVKQLVSLSKAEWDSFENSWDFIRHPLVGTYDTVQEAFRKWSVECETRFNQMKLYEEELNSTFIDIYGLQEELTPDEDDKDITIRKADLTREIKSLISYAVGCMLGRYSPDEDGLVYAGGDWDAFKYHSYPADKDNIIPICDDDYFEDDIVGRFVKFIETVYGTTTLEENLKFIADVLGGNGTSREVIRTYFLNDFYSDHCSTYSLKGAGKRPIYWLFDSGKKNGFKALIYMHRYQPDTIARMRTDYVHEQQERYHTAIAHLEERINNAPTSERVKLNKQLSKLKDQATEIRVYEEKIHHLADQMIRIDLDDGVKKNYGLLKDVLAEIK
ncbi:MAG: BREX-1 system adenine-specific DNA-methyltransferase PglX [Clostridia bacterium]|mgnify:CR=1 FL=1|nr:BREX-1 system adenine-specific DNA-methyltransferase PglX [Clostridia bacterium]